MGVAAGPPSMQTVAVRVAIALVTLVVASVLSIATSAAGPEGAKPAPVGLSYTRVAGRLGNGLRSVWVAAADGSNAREAVRNGDQSAVSADGRWLMFERYEQRSSGPGLVLLMLMDLATGRTRGLGELDDSLGNERWSPTGAELAVTEGRRFFLIDAASGKRTELLGRPVGPFDFTPDGGSVVLTLGSGIRSYNSSERSDLFQLKLSGGALKRITYDRHSRSPLVGQTGIAYVRFKNPFVAPEAWFMTRDGHQARRLARCCESKEDVSHGDATRGYETVALSKDGTRLLTCEISSVQCPPVVIDLKAGRHFVFPRLGSIIPSNESATAVDISADGRTVLVSVGPPHDGPGRWRLYAVPLSGGTPRLLAADAWDGHWSH